MRLLNIMMAYWQALTLNTSATGTPALPVDILFALGERLYGVGRSAYLAVNYHW
ncbi:MAG: hypothetical protein WEB02_01300 [Methylophaga sp.]